MNDAKPPSQPCFCRTSMQVCGGTTTSMPSSSGSSRRPARSRSSAPVAPARASMNAGASPIPGRDVFRGNVHRAGQSTMNSVAPVAVDDRCGSAPSATW
jgi:hypothetical protein